MARIRRRTSRFGGGIRSYQCEHDIPTRHPLGPQRHRRLRRRLGAASRRASFYDTFPSAGFGPWVGVDGPFNEHLIRDVGALYLALVGAGVVAALSRRADASIAVGVAWLVFSVPHFTYHLAHLHGLAPLDAVAQPISLALSLVLEHPLVIPPRRRATPSEPATAHEQEPLA